MSAWEGVVDVVVDAVVPVVGTVAVCSAAAAGALAPVVVGVVFVSVLALDLVAVGADVAVGRGSARHSAAAVSGLVGVLWDLYLLTLYVGLCD